MPTRTDTDALHLARAIELAERGRGRVSPNPLVGAVLVRDGKVIGEGHHADYGGPHAEAAAIAAAGDADLRGATMYVSLEPCCHEGKTPPCTEAIAAAGVARVVIGSDDPSEHASGLPAGDGGRGVPTHRAGLSRGAARGDGRAHRQGRRGGRGHG